MDTHHYDRTDGLMVTITHGGVSHEDISPDIMQSKIIRGVYFNTNLTIFLSTHTVRDKCTLPHI